MVKVRVETIVSVPISACFDLARSVSTHPLTTLKSRERVVSKHDRDLLELGDELTLEATHFRVQQRLSSKIVEFDRPTSFTDQMTKGAFKSFRHQHLFESLLDGATKMTDILEFESPLGPLGRLVDRLFMRKYMERFIRERGLAFNDVAGKL